MAETVTVVSSDSEPDAPPKKALPKRRRLLTSTAIPVYSTQVERGLKLLDNPMKLPDEIKARCNKNLDFSSDEDEDEEKPIPLKQLKSRPRFQFSSRKAEFKPLLCLFSFWQMSRPNMFSFPSSTAKEGSCQSPIRNWYFWK